MSPLSTRRHSLSHIMAQATRMVMGASAKLAIWPDVDNGWYYDIDFGDATLEEAARILGQSARYASYCASSIADQRITLSTLGTLDELAHALAREAKVQVVVDHHNHEVRFIASRNAVEPQFLEQRNPRRLNNEY